MSSIEQNIEKLGLNLPVAGAPAAAYVPFRVHQNTAFISGQLPMIDGALTHTGHVGENVNVEEAQKAAHNCALNLLSQLKAACNGDLGNVTAVIKLEILVAAPKDFTQAHVVANGASELMISVFGEEIGKHARVAYGVSVLPLNAAVEVAATFAVK